MHDVKRTYITMPPVISMSEYSMRVLVTLDEISINVKTTASLLYNFF